MGLISFWTSITGPRVREIASPSEDFWPDRGRPATASAIRKKSAGSGGEERSRTANGEKRIGRLARSLSRPRRKQTADKRTTDSTAEPQLPAVPTQDIAKDLPRVPSLPVLAFQDNVEDDATPPEDLGRPGTAITTEGLQELQIFELSGEPTPPPVETEPETPCENPLIRRRSQSVGPERKPVFSRKGSWFRVGTGKNKALPPPPPPTGPLPPVPTAKAPAQAGSSTPASETFPPVPSLLSDNDETSDSSVTNSEVGSLHQPTSPSREQGGFNIKTKRSLKPIQTNPLRGHKHQDSAIGTPKSPHTPTGIKRWTRQICDTDDEPFDVRFFDEPLQEWDGETKEPQVDIYSLPSPQSNDQALAALQFGVLK